MRTSASNRVIAYVLAALMSAASATTALADASEKAAAQALFDAGRELAARGELVEACDKFEGSQSLDPAVGTMLFLGDCYEKTGRSASAWSMFRDAESMARETGQPGREAIAHTRAEALAASLPRVRLQVPDDHRVDRLEIRVGGLVVPRASWDVPLPIDPGEQVVSATAPGHDGWSMTVHVEQGSLQQVLVPRLPEAKVELPPRRPADEPAAEIAPMDDPSRGRAQRVAGIVVGGVGLTGVVIASVLGVQALRKNDDSLEYCRPEDPTLCSDTGVALRTQASDLALGSTVGFASGGAALLAGLITFLTAPSSRAPREAGATIGLVRPSFSEQGASLAIGGSW